MFLALSPEKPALLGDSNPELVNLYGVVRDHPRALMQALDVLRSLYSEEFYYLVRSRPEEDPIERAARTVFLNKCGFNGLYRVNSKDKFNVPFGKRARCPALYHVENLLAASARFQRATLVHSDFESVLAQAGAGDFVYCDPPYEPISRTAAFTSYIPGGFSQTDQARLQIACRGAADRGAAVAISNSNAPFIVSLYAEWSQQPILARRAVNVKGDGRGEVTELLLMRNIALPATQIA